MSLFRNLVPSLNRNAAPRDTEGESGAEPSLRPFYELKEAGDAWGLQVHLPGVSKSGLEFTAEEGLITVRGRREWKAPAGWATLHRESADAPFELVLQHDNTIDVERIHAEIKDGVLRVSLPKTESVKPRKIAVN